MHGRIAEARAAAQGRRHQGGRGRHPRDRVRRAALPDGARRARRGLRTPSTRAALAAIGERGLIEPARVRALAPPTRSCAASSTACSTTTTSRRRRCRATRSTAPRSPRRWTSPTAGARGALDGHRAASQEAFDALFERQARRPRRGASTPRSSIPQAPPDPRRSPRRSPSRASPSRGRRRAPHRVHALAPLPLALGRSRAKVETLLPAWSPRPRPRAGERRGRAPDRALEAIDRREAYFSLLLEYPAGARARRAPDGEQRAGPRACSRATRSCSTSSRAPPRASPPPTGGRARGARRASARARGDVERSSTTCATTSSARCCASPSPTSRASCR
jgi:hypothetical protein